MIKCDEYKKQLSELSVAKKRERDSGARRSSFLSEQAKGMETQIQALKDELYEATSTIKDHKKGGEEQQRDLQQARQQQATLNAERVALDAQIRELMVRNCDLEAKLEQANGLHSQSSLETETLRVQAQQLVQKVQAKEATITSLYKEKGATEARLGHLEASLAEATCVDPDASAALLEQLLLLQEALEQKESEVGLLQGQVEELQHNQTGLNERAHMQQSLVDAQEQLTQAEVELQDTQTALELAQAQALPHDENGNTVHDELRHVNDLLCNSQQQCGELFAANESLDSRVQELEKDNQKAQAQCLNFKRALFSSQTELSSVRKSLGATRKSLGDVEREGLRKLRSEWKEAQGDLQAKQAEMARAESGRQQHELDKQAKNEEAMRLNEELVQRLQEEVAALSSSQAAAIAKAVGDAEKVICEERQAEVQQLQQYKAEVLAMQHQHKQRLQECEASLSELRAQLEDKEKAIQSLTEQMPASSGEAIEQQRQELLQLSSDYKAKECQLRAMSQELAAGSNRVNAFTSTISKLQGQLDALGLEKQALSAKASQVAELESHIAQAQAQADASLSSERSRATELAEKLSKQLEANAALKSQAEDAWKKLLEKERQEKKEVDRVQAKADVNVELIQQRESLIDKLKEQAALMETRLASAEDEVAQLRFDNNMAVQKAVDFKTNEMQLEMEHLMTQQAGQISQLLVACKNKEEVTLLNGPLMKRTSKGMIRWHKRFCKLTTKHLLCWSDSNMAGRCRFIELKDVQEIHVHDKRGEESKEKEKDSDSCSFEMKTRFRSFIFQCKDNNNLRQWVAKLDQAINTTEFAEPAPLAQPALNL